MIWPICYLLGLAVLTSGTIYYWVNRKRHHIPTLWLMACLLFTLFIWYLPIEMNLDSYSIPEGVLSAIIQGIAALRGGLYNKHINGASEATALVYSISIMAIRLLVFFITMDVLLFLLNGPKQYVKCFFQRHRKTYIFLEANSKEIHIARSISNKKPPRLIFFGEEDMSAAEIDEVESVGGIYFTKDAPSMFSHIFKKGKYFPEDKPLEVFLFSKEEEKNLMCLTQICKLIEAADNMHARIYVESMELLGEMQDVFSTKFGDSDRITVNFVHTERNFSYNNLHQTSIFEHAQPDGKHKRIKALLIGDDPFVLEMLKCILWLGQMPGFFVQLQVVSKRGFSRKLQYLCPGLEFSVDEEGLAHYSMDICEIDGYDSADFSKILHCSRDFSFAFVSSGSDIVNYNIATALCSERERSGISGSFRIQIRNRNIAAEKDADKMILDHVYEVGFDQDLYSYINIANSTIEQVAQEIHEARQREKPESERTPWQKYCREEYSRQSVYARALSMRYKLKLTNGEPSLLSTDPLWVRYEHMRWCTYMWTQGFIYGEKKCLKFGKTHPSLRPFAELDAQTQEKNAMNINPSLTSHIVN